MNMTEHLFQRPCLRSAKRALFAILCCFIFISARPIEAHCQATRSANNKPAPTAKPDTSGSWLHWGGPRRDFIATSNGIASSWPGDGPQKLWSRLLGDGYAGIAVEGTILYTAYRRDPQEVIVAINANTGETIWEYAYDNPFKSAYSENISSGPRAMPQVIGDRLVTASATGKIHSIDKRKGRPVWSRDLYSEFGGNRLEFGYSCHALPYKDNLILLAGGQGSAALSLRQKDGAVVWKNLSFNNAHSSPVLIEVDGQPQVVALLASEVIGFDPENGQLLWRHPHETQYGLAISTPVWLPGNLLFVSSAYDGGSRVLQLRLSGGKTEVKEVWVNRRLQSHFGAVIRQGDYLYFSEGHNGPPLMTCVNFRNGEVAWQQRGFAKAQLLSADGKLILLDEDGTLALVEATPKELRTLSKVSLLESVSWTPPTLAGTKLYLRDRRRIIALDLKEAGANRSFRGSN
jgi:outer membrane protein assembly factor BamB